MIFHASSQIHGAEAVYWLSRSYGSKSGSHVTPAKDMKDWLISLVVQEDPNSLTWSPSLTKPACPKYGSERRTLFVTEQGVQNLMDMDMAEKCDFWNNNSQITRI
ncbi:hypothetical protein BT63DRAFT_456658 [Microthyrium microscopicum]|uniref:Uncharacterized protein n=1 Tax=Microthyrium microscopicum TaxID=703497 RepID=A0A6A6U8Y4_9PEZI|nr:hypothetical protein BT63DRAFT_456658 [Microthyrium microscopicum]